MRRGILQLKDLGGGGESAREIIRRPVAPTWVPIYISVLDAMDRLERERLGPQPDRPPGQSQATPIWHTSEFWSASWKTKSMLLHLRSSLPPTPRADSATWKAFKKLQLPWIDKDFIRVVLWKKLPLAKRLTPMTGGQGKCPLDGLLEDHTHFLRSCRFNSFTFYILRQTFGLVQQDDLPAVEPSRLVSDHPALSLTTTQGLLVWAALRCSWTLRCDKALGGGGDPTLDTFVATWRSKLTFWQRAHNMSVSRKDLACFLDVLTTWLESHRILTLGAAPGPTHA